MVALGPINSWQPAQGPVTTWTASDASREIMAKADRDPLPPSFQQASHLRAAFYGRALGRQLPRLMVVSWDIEGTCDIVAMTTAINTHIRRHDTYHSAFGFENGNIFRRTIAAPEQIEFVPFSYGEMGAEDIREHALTSTPDTLDWDCFTFGIVQKRRPFHVLCQCRPSAHRRHVRGHHLPGHPPGISGSDRRAAGHAGRGRRVPRIHRSAERAGRQDGSVLPRDPGLDLLRTGHRRRLAEFPAGARRHLVEHQGRLHHRRAAQRRRDGGLRFSLPRCRRTLHWRRHGVRGAGRAPAHRQHHLSRLHPVGHPHAG